jgi:hypothetical protein
MSGPALFHIAFIAVVVMILLTVWAAMVLEVGERPPGRTHQARDASQREVSDQKGTPL